MKIKYSLILKRLAIPLFAVLLVSNISYAQESGTEEPFDPDKFLKEFEERDARLAQELLILPSAATDFSDFNDPVLEARSWAACFAIYELIAKNFSTLERSEGGQYWHNLGNGAQLATAVSMAKDSIQYALKKKKLAIMMKMLLRNFLILGLTPGPSLKV